MELLIPGLILVTLMVYVSTRIKKSAAKAFEPEKIEGNAFSIEKPDGFLHPLNDDSGLLFRAYSKEFGRDYASDIRKATVELAKIENDNYTTVCEKITSSTTRVIEREERKIEGRQVCLIAAEGQIKEISTINYYKVIRGNKCVYRLKAVVLPEFEAEYRSRIDTMMTTLTIK